MMPTLLFYDIEDNYEDYNSTLRRSYVFLLYTSCINFKHKECFHVKWTHFDIRQAVLHFGKRGDIWGWLIGVFKMINGVGRGTGVVVVMVILWAWWSWKKLALQPSFFTYRGIQTLCVVLRHRGNFKCFLHYSSPKLCKPGINVYQFPVSSL